MRQILLGIAVLIALLSPTVGRSAAVPEGMAATSKAFAASLRKPFSDETAGALRRFIDPRYLKKHNLEKGPFPIQRVVTGRIYDNTPVDARTMFVVVETKEAEKEVWLLRMTEYKGEVYILPPAPPDPTTRSFQPWIFRRKF